MRNFLKRANAFLDAPLELGPRLVVLCAALALVPTFTSPLYTMTMFAPQYPDGLRLFIYSYKLVGGNGGQDVKEINVLNHYIGMRDLATEDFGEFKWMPFVIGAFVLLFARTLVMGKMTHLVDSVVLFVYFGAFALWSFGYKMWTYGHNLAPTAAVKVAPFMPPMFGYKQLANFEVYSYPALGSYALGASAALMVIAFFLAARQARRTVAA
jgi:copper chaperone NosL